MTDEKKKKSDPLKGLKDSDVFILSVGLGVPGLPPEITLKEAKDQGAETLDLLGDALTAGTYQLKKSEEVKED